MTLQTMAFTTAIIPSLVSKREPNYQAIFPIRLSGLFPFFNKPIATTRLGLLRFRTYPSIKASVALDCAADADPAALTIDCNERIRRLCNVGSLKDAVDTLSGSSKSELDLNTYCLLLQACAESRTIELGRRVHSVILSNELRVEDILGAKLVFMYVNCGDFSEGRRIFDEIRNDKVFLWNFMINEYSKIGNFQEGLFLYQRMRELRIDPNSYTFSCAFKCFSGLRSIEEGERAHAHLLKLGFGTYNVVDNSLISFYFRFGRTGSAQKVFDELTDRDAISWNSMISGYASNGFPWKGISHFKQMIFAGFPADLATVLCVLAACADIGVLSMGKMFHAYAMKGSFDRDLRIGNTLLDMYSKCGDLNSSVQVFKSMGDKSVVSWTAMVSGYAREGLSDTAIKLFHDMEDEDIKPDSFAITNALHSCASSGLLERGRKLHDYISRNNLQFNLAVCNALLDMYVKCGSMGDAQSVFNGMAKKDNASWNIMIGGYSKNSLPNEALYLFLEMQRVVVPDSVTMACVLPALASLATLEKGREVHAHVLRNGYFSDPYVANSLMDMYVKCGGLSLACLVFNMIHSKDRVSWTIMIAGFCMHGLGVEAMKTFNEMKSAGIEPDHFCFASILSACTHSGLIREGWMLYEEMKSEYQIEPNMDHYACMVDLFARSGKLKMAYKFIEIIEDQPKAKFWAALLRRCRVHRDVKMAEKVAEHLFEIEPDNADNYAHLANIYAEAEKWAEIEYQGVMKNAGSSWLEVKDKVHVFVAGNTSHPESRKIKLLLERLRTKMKEEIFPITSKYLPVNENQMEKKVAVCGHSEQLALAFGVLNLSPWRTIRITKNSRMCRECHDVGKFVSRSYVRDIVLRDSNRFHHFRDGHCSCRG